MAWPRRRWAIAIACAFLAALVIVVAFRPRPDRRPPITAPGAGGSAATAPGAGRSARPGGAPAAIVPGWLLGEDRPRTRIAGTVVSAHGASPVPGATVRLASWASAVAGAPMAVATADAGGRFDFGDRPRGSYTLAAFAPGRGQVAQRLNLNDPRSVPPSDRVELRLEDCAGVVYGTVRDGSGGPIIGARVRPAEAAAFPAEADLDGGYELCVPEGRVAFVVAADGYGGVEIDLDVKRRIRRDIVLEPEGAIAGRCVTKEDGRPLAFALVAVTPQASGAEVPARSWASSDAAGRFRAAGLRPGRYVVGGDAPDAATADDLVVAVTGGGAPAEVVLTFARTATVKGRVVLDGKPVAGAQVSARLATARRATTATYSDEGGGFELRRVQRGENIFSVAPYRVVSPSSARIDLPVEPDIVIQVARMAAIRGRVLREGRIVAGVEVTCRGGGALAARPSVSDGEGRYACEGLAAGTYAVAARDVAAGAWASGSRVVVADGEEKNVDVELELSASIGGVVVDQDGAPVREARVRFANRQLQDFGDDVTDAEGRFAVRMLSGGGTYVATVSAGDAPGIAYSPARPFPEVPVLDADSHVEGVRLEIRRSILSIAGTVATANGEPAVDARVVAQRVAASALRYPPGRALPTAVVDIDGRFVIRELPPGDYALEARGVDGATASAETVPAGTSGVRLELVAVARIAGTLVGFGSLPVVKAHAAGGDVRSYPGSVAGDRFSVDGLPPGRYVVSATSASEGAAAEVEVRAGAVVSVELASHGTATIVGRAVDLATGAPVAGLRCHVVPRVGELWSATDWGGDLGSFATGADGSFAVDAAPAGAVYVQCVRSVPDCSGAGRSLDLVAGQRSDVELAVVHRDPARRLKGFASMGAVLHPYATVPRLLLVQPGGPAGQAGLVPGDVIVQVDGIATRDLANDAVSQLVLDRDPGALAALTIVRGGELRAATLVVGPPSLD